MKLSFIIVVSLAIMIAASAMSGCTVVSKQNATATAAAGTPTPDATATDVSTSKIKIVESGDTITITGGAGENVRSDKNIKLSSEDPYLVTLTNGGAPTSFCSISIGDVSVPAEESSWGSKAVLYYEKGTFVDDDIPVIINEAHGPWTMIIQKNPKLERLVAGNKVNGSAGITTSGTFNLDQGTATFKFKRNTIVEPYSMGIHLVLYNVDEGMRTEYLWWNSNDASYDATVDIPDTGNYIISGDCPSDWEATITQ